MKFLKSLVLCSLVSAFGLSVRADFWSNIDPTNKKGALRQTVDGVGEATGIQPGRWAGEAIQKIPSPSNRRGSDESYLSVMTNIREYYLIANDTNIEPLNFIIKSDNSTTRKAIGAKKFDSFSYTSSYGSNSGNVQNFQAPTITFDRLLAYGKDQVISVNLSEIAGGQLSRDPSNPTIFVFRQVSNNDIQLLKRVKPPSTGYDKYMQGGLGIVKTSYSYSPPLTMNVTFKRTNGDSGVFSFYKDFLPMEWIMRDPKYSSLLTEKATIFSFDKFPSMVVLQFDNILMGFIPDCRSGQIMMKAIGEKNNTLITWLPPKNEFIDKFVNIESVANSPQEIELFATAFKSLCSAYPVTL